MKTKRAVTSTRDWTQTEQGTAARRAARAQAQEKANATGFDYGLERNDLFKSFHTFMLPGKQYRQGHELRCEVVSCEDLSKCQKGHGP